MEMVWLTPSLQSISTGRGGAGNIREGRGLDSNAENNNVVNAGEAEYERRLIREHESTHATGTVGRSPPSPKDEV
jgi:hypothetical protein